MFESQVAFYLNKYLGTYLEGIDSQSLRISVFKGNVELRNLQLKPDALNDLDLPIVVKAGLLGSLKLKVPWSSLGRVPVEVQMDRLYVLAAPKPEEERGKGVSTVEDVDVEYQRSKRQRVQRQEQAWVEELEQLEEQRQRKKAGEGETPPRMTSPGMLKAVIDTVLGNLQLSITNVHVRYEDDLSNPGQPFACGVTLERVSATTVDEKGRETFVTNNPMDILRKAAQLRRMAVYFDTGIQFWDPGSSWRGMPVSQWDSWFQPGITLGQHRAGTAKRREYVLQPVDGRAFYTRRGAAAPRGDGIPVLDINFELDVVAVQLTQPQYQSYQLLLSEVSSFTARLPFLGYRPRLRPAAGTPARVWWRYAFRAVRSQQTSRALTWQQSVKMAKMRTAYVPAYVQYLEATEAKGWARHELQGKIEAMDRELPESSILMFRRLAHAEVQRARRREARAAARSGEAAGKQSGGGGGGGGWLGWLTGGAVGQGDQGQESQEATATGGELRGDLSPEEYSRLLELVNEQEEGLRMGTETPYTLLTRVGARVGSASAVLVGADGVSILRGGLDGVVGSMDKYPETSKVTLEVTAMGVESPEGVFIRTGGELHQAASAAQLSADTVREGQEQGEGGRALRISYTQAPQDGSADAVLDVVLQPSYVHYSAATTDRVLGFFKTPQELDFSGISAAATSQLERAKRLAAEYAAATLRSKPKLKMSLCLDAPKVAIPAGDGKGRVTLVLDLGRFVVRSDHEAAGKLPAEQAALYECIRLEGRDVLAYLVDGEFRWSHEDEGITQIPLLERCGLEVALQAARFPDPRFATIRLQPSVPVLHFYLSPARLGRLMRVLRAALPEGEEEGEGGGGAAMGAEPWRQHAEHEGSVRVLTWTGIGKASVVWAPKYAVVYQGRLYLFDSATSPKPTAVHSFWADGRLARVPPDCVGGVADVVGILGAGVDVSKAAVDSSAVLLRLEDPEQADLWYRQLATAQHAMRQLSGQDAPALPEWDEASSTVSASDAEDSASSALAALPPTPGQPAQQAQHGPLTLLQVDAKLGELAVFVSGREPAVWWPPGEAFPSQEARAAEACDSPVFRPEDIVNVDGEGALIALRASGGVCTFTYGDGGMVVRTALGSLEIEDLLVGPRCPEARFLARSSLPMEEAVQTGGDLFFDPDEALAEGGLSGSRSGSLAPYHSLPLSEGGRGGGAQEAQQELAEFEFRLLRPDSPDYKGVDSALDISLRTLYFYCNRPTVAALMTFGTDVSVAVAGAQVGGGGDGLGGGCGEGGAASQDAAQGGVQGLSEEVGDAAKMLGGGKGGRVVFQLNLSLSRLQVVLNYEGAQWEKLSQASMDDFSFQLKVLPDRLAITSALGNVSLVDCTLPPTHPYRQALGLRAGSDSSLVVVNFDSYPATERNPRLPANLPYYSLTAKLSELQVVFLYRFLSENLQYISSMLAMRLQPEGGGAQLAQQQDGTQQAQQEREETQQAQQMPFLLLLDVHMDAPVISMPRTTNSRDAIEADLGVLKLSNTIVRHASGAGAGKGLLLDASSLSFSGVGLTVLRNGRRGGNIVQNSDQGWQIRWRRPLEEWYEGVVPFFDFMLEVAFLKATVTDEEYQLITSVAADNVFEELVLPPGGKWINDHYQELLLRQQEQAQQTPAPGPPAAGSELAAADAAGVSTGRGSAGRASGQPSIADDPATKVRVVVSLGQVELEIQRQLEGVAAPMRLARFMLGDLWVSFRNSASGSMWVALNLPRVEAQDLRQEVPLEQSYVISSAHKASFLALDWSASPELVHQSLAVTIQKPLFVAELSFLLEVTKWVVPSLTLGGSTPIPHTTHDIHMSGNTHVASGDLWLSPMARLLADAPGTTTFEYDGRGHRLILPEKAHLDEQLPLIVIGAGRTLRLRDVRIIHSSSLPVCLQLAPGASLLAEAVDGVSKVAGREPELPRTLSPASPRSLFARGFSAYASPTTSSELTQEPSTAHDPPGAGPAAQAPRSMDISILAVGMGLQFLHLQSDNNGPPGRPPPAGAVARQHGERPGSSNQSGRISRHSRRGSIDSGSGDSKQPSRQPSASELGHPSQRHKQAGAPRMVQVLSAFMDLGVKYAYEGSIQSGKVAIQGLRVETRFLADAAARVQSRNEEQDFTKKKKLKGRLEGTVLEPCTIGLDFRLQPGFATEGLAGRTDLNLDTSDLHVNLSPDVLELANSLATSIVRPFMQPKSDRPVISCAAFERIWTFDASEFMPDQQHMAANLSVEGVEGGVTVWRPVCPPGYGSVGDIVTAGSSQPTFEVLAVAINSGLAAFPASFECVWAGAGGCMWRPVPPDGYLAVGSVVTCQGDPEPHPSSLLCLHESVCVEVPMGECLHLPPRLPSAPAAAAEAQQRVDPVDLWCVDSSLGTFLAASKDSPMPGQGLDLRSPLGVSPAALAELSLPQPVGSHALFQHFCASRTRQRSEEVQKVVTPSVSDFRRVWTDGGSLTAGEGVSIWRPVVPPGYTSLGDCIMRGLAPPAWVTVVQDNRGEGDGLGQGSHLPLVSHPQGFHRIWMDMTAPDARRLCFWAPVPRPGYVAMGCLTTVGTQAPPRGAAKCLRADAAVQDAGSSRSPLWLVRQQERGMNPLTVWVADDRLRTFVIEGGDQAKRPREVWKMKSLDNGEASVHGAQAGGVSVVARTGRASVLLRDSFRVPILEVDLGTLSAGVSGPSQQVIQAHVKFRLSMWSYNPSVKGWDPVVEPWDVLANLDANLKARVAHGIEPGMHLSLKTSNEVIYTTITFAALHSLLTSYADWQVIRSGDSYRQLLAAADASTIKVDISNKLGVGASMELDFGDELKTVLLPPDQTTPVLKPLPHFPLRQQEGLNKLLAGKGGGRGALPFDLLLLDIEAVSGSTLAPGQMYCTAKLDCGSEAVPSEGAPFRTRAVAAEAGSQGRVEWQERLVLPLPIQPAGQLTLVLEVWNASGRCGQGALVGTAAVPLPAVSTLKERERQPIRTQMGEELLLEGSFMLQHQWRQGAHPSKAAMAPAWAESTVGQRALSLASNADVWAVVPAVGQQKAAPGAHAASLTPIRLGSQGVVLQSTVEQGARRETLRAPCQVVNSTQYVLEVCLITVEDDDWQEVAPRAGSVSAALSQGLVEEEVFESQRWISLKGWSHTNLRPEDPARFTHQRRQYQEMPQVALPAGWEWEGGWVLDRSGAVDKEGWSYAVDFQWMKFPPPPGSQKPSLADTVRSRRWQRLRRPTTARRAGAGASSAALLTPAQHPQGLVVRERQELGRVDPGDALPLPLHWNVPGKQLQLRPVMDPELSSALHEWSLGSEQGLHTVKLECLDEGITRLVSCAPSFPPASPTVETSEEGSTLWFSLTVDSDILSAGSQADPIIDWRIMVGPPLVLANQLPIPGTLLVWEKAQSSSQLLHRQTVRMDTGGQVPVHTADMRTQVSFTLYTDAYEWVEAAPLLVSEGHQGRPGKRQLPDRFRLRRHGGSIPVEVFVQRNIEFGTWLLDAREELDPGAVVARGVPLTVTVMSPLWVVNATSLAIDAAIVQVPPPPPVPKQDLSTQAASAVQHGAACAAPASLGQHERLRTIVTRDGPRSPGGEASALRGRPIAPRSLEILSYPLPSHVAAAQAPGGEAPAPKRQHYGVRLRVAGSGWTPPLALDVVEVGASPHGQPEAHLQNAQPLLIQARASEYSAVYEVVARLEVTPFRNSQVLRLEPHVVVSNRTGVPLQLMQCRPMLAAGSGTGVPGRSMSGTIVPEGGTSFTTGAGAGSGRLPAGLQAPSALVRPHPSFNLGVTPSFMDRRWDGSPGPSFVQLSGDSVAAWERAPSVLPDGPAPLVQVPRASQRALGSTSTVVDLPAGATAVPLHLTSGSQTHTVCIRGLPPSSATVVPTAPPLWSRPISVRYPMEQTLHLLVPVGPEEAAQKVQSRSGSQEEGEAASPTRASAYLSPAVFETLEGGPDDAGGRSGRRDSAHLTVVAGEAASKDMAVAVLRLSISRRGLGGMLLTLETLQSDPPYLLENRTPYPLDYRQAHVRGSPYHILPPWTSVGYLWEYSVHGVPYQLEMREAGGARTQLYSLDPEAGGAGTDEEEDQGQSLVTAAQKVQPLPVTGEEGQCTVKVHGREALQTLTMRVSHEFCPAHCLQHTAGHLPSKLGYWEQVAMGTAGVLRIGGESSGGGLGRGGIDRVLQLVPGSEPLLLKGLGTPSGAALAMDIALELPGLEVSLVDHTPQELLLLSLQGLKVYSSSGSNPGGSHTSLHFTLQHLQVDDQLAGARFPVVLAVAPSSLAARQKLSQVAGDLPLLQFTLATQTGGARGRSFYPYIGFRAPHTVQLAISESLVWHLVDFMQRVQAQQAQHATRPSAAAAGSEGASHGTATADKPLRIGLLHVDDLRAELSFQGDPLARPRYISGGMVSTMLDLANFTGAAVTLRGLEDADIAMLRSSFLQRIVQKVQGQLFNVGISLVRNFGIAGGASKLLGVLSAGVAKLAKTEASPEAAAQKQQQRRPISDVGDGVLEGVGALGQSFVRGLKNIVHKPVQGAKQKGVGGAVVGIGSGIIGAFASPVSGMLDALSATAEGFQASFGKRRDDSLVWQRRRLPRLVNAEGRVPPILGGDGSDRQARIDALGQALLRNSLLAAPDSLLSKRHEPSESYEQHFVLLKDFVTILTNGGVRLLEAPGFAIVDRAAEIGEELDLVDVPPGRLVWFVRWEDLLCLELKWSSDDPNADRLIVHRKGRPGRQESESLAHQLQCFPRTGQAAHIKMVVQKLLGKYCLDVRRSEREWARRRQAQQDSAESTKELPLTMPCMDFQLCWRTPPYRGGVVSFWRPVAPPGYSPGGDVVTIGTEPPPLPVSCFQDLSHALPPGCGGAPHGTSAGTAGGTGPGRSKPPTARPKEHSLVWRQNGSTPVTVWMPVAPLGYKALGAVVVGAAEPPAVEDYLVVREDLTSPTRVFDSPIWTLDPLSLLGPGGGGQAASTAAAMALQRSKSHHPETWKVSVWQADNQLGTFLAMRSFSRPPPNMVCAVDLVEAQHEMKRRSSGGG